jgi:hypothetical protein
MTPLSRIYSIVLLTPAMVVMLPIVGIFFAHLSRVVNVKNQDILGSNTLQVVHG